MLSPEPLSRLCAPDMLQSHRQTRCSCQDAGTGACRDGHGKQIAAMQKRVNNQGQKNNMPQLAGETSSCGAVNR
jgi:hypothetical protein